MKDPTFFAIIAGAGLLTGFLLAVWLGNPPRRSKVWRWIKCLCGNHSPDRVRAEVGGRNVQRCLYCDKVVREYTVTKDGAKKNPVIRRKY